MISLQDVPQREDLHPHFLGAALITKEGVYGMVLQCLLQHRLHEWMTLVYESCEQG